MTEPHLIRERATERFPNVLLTLVSIVQALALEVLWSSVEESPYLWSPEPGAWIGWLQVSALFLGIVVVWLFYSSLMMRLIWLPATRDSILPFLIGVLEFSLAEMLEPEHRALWFWLLAVLFVLCSWTSAATFRRARIDPRNQRYFENFDPYSVRSTYAPLGFCVVLTLSGLGTAVWGPESSVAGIGMLLTNVLFVLQILIIRSFWRRSMATV